MSKITQDKKQSAEMEDQWPVLAICYDFDKTLSPKNMQEFGLIQDLGYDDSPNGMRKFWREVERFAKKQHIDVYLAGMYYFIRKMRKSGMKICADTFRDYGKQVQLFQGVSTWFDRIRTIGKRHHVKIEHYVISAGYKEIIEGTSIFKKLNGVFASTFYFDEDHEHVWAGRVLDFTGKTQVLYRIKKNKMDENDPSVNEHVKKNRVPFRNMVYIGDSGTDIPCMQIVKENGGNSIGVYQSKCANKERILEIMKDGRLSFYKRADYSAGSDLEKIVTAIIEKTEKCEKLQIEYEKMQESFKRTIKNQEIKKSKKANAKSKNGSHLDNTARNQNIRTVQDSESVIPYVTMDDIRQWGVRSSTEGACQNFVCGVSPWKDDCNQQDFRTRYLTFWH